ncbi:MAG: hypothetical protein LBI36_03320 [Oscillospiraceae bacterium]|nr:hypothetical protein [Oscillospiraceae bacterium]
MYLKEKTKTTLKRSTGLEYEEILAMSHDEEMAYVKKAHPHIGFPKEAGSRKIGRGNPLLARRKIRTFQDLDEKFENLKRVK